MSHYPQVGDPITVFQPNNNGSFTLLHKRVGWSHPASPTFRYEGNYNEVIEARREDEGIAWVRGFAERRHKRARAMIAAQRLLR